MLHTPVKQKEPGSGQAEQDQMAEQMMPMMAQMFKDMRVSFVVDVQGAIVKTKAVNRQRQRVTLMDIEFGKILADPAKFKAMEELKDLTSPEAKALLKTIPDVKGQMENPVRISFK